MKQKISNKKIQQAIGLLSIALIAQAESHDVLWTDAGKFVDGSKCGTGKGEIDCSKLDFSTGNTGTIDAPNTSLSRWPLGQNGASEFVENNTLTVVNVRNGISPDYYSPYENAIAGQGTKVKNNHAIVSLNTLYPNGYVKGSVTIAGGRGDEYAGYNTVDVNYVNTEHLNRKHNQNTGGADFVGGVSFNGLVEHNTVNINGIGNEIKYLDKDGNETNQEVGYFNVYGGNAESYHSGAMLSTAEGIIASTNANTVNIKNSSNINLVYGGKSNNGAGNNLDAESTADFNVVNIDNSHAVTVYGGEGGNIHADQNKVAITNSEIYGSVTGGSSIQGDANENIVLIKDSTVKGSVNAGNGPYSSRGNLLQIENSTTGRVVTGNGAQRVDSNRLEISNSTVQAATVGKAGSGSGKIKPVDAALSNNSGIIENSTVKENAVLLDGGYLIPSQITNNSLEIRGDEAGKSSVGGHMFGVSFNIYDSNKPEEPVLVNDNRLALENTPVGMDGKYVIEDFGIAGGSLRHIYFNNASADEKTPVRIENNSIDITGNGGVGGNIDLIAGGRDYYKFSEADISNNTLNIGLEDKPIDSEFTVGANITAVKNFNGNITDNNINIFATDDAEITVGGKIRGAANLHKDATRSGNNLNLGSEKQPITVKNKIKAAGIEGFDEINFYLPSNLENGDTALELTGNNKSDLSNTTVNAYLPRAGANVAAGDVVHLISNTGSGTISDIKDGKVYRGVALSADIADIVKTDDDKNLDLSFKQNLSYNPSFNQNGTNTGNVGLNNGQTPLPSHFTVDTKTKSFPESTAASLGLLRDGSNNFATAVRSSDRKNRTGGMEKNSARPIVYMDASRKRYESGSYVNNNGISLTLGGAFDIAQDAGASTLGAYLEHGKANYDSHLDDGTSADGDISYTGVGLYARHKLNSGFYGEANFRAGRAKQDYESRDFVFIDPQGNIRNDEKYDLSRNYVGGSIGIGQEIELGSNTLDLYARYNHTHLNAGTATLTSGEEFHSKASNSRQVQVGVRDNIELGHGHNLFFGAGYEYEMSGTANATIDGYGITTPSLKGSSGTAEVGYSWQPENSPLSFDIAARGTVGKARGGQVRAGFTYRFN